MIHPRRWGRIELSCLWAVGASRSPSESLLYLQNGTALIKPTVTANKYAAFNTFVSMHGHPGRACYFSSMAGLQLRRSYVQSFKSRRRERDLAQTIRRLPRRHFRPLVGPPVTALFVWRPITSGITPAHASRDV